MDDSYQLESAHQDGSLGCAHSTRAGPELVIEPLGGRDLEAA